MPLNNSGRVALILLLGGSGGGAAQAQRVPPPPRYDSPRATVPITTLDQPAPPADLPQGDGPRGTSGQGERYDAVGYAGSFGGGVPQYSTASISVGHGSLPPGSYVELTALDTGRTILAIVAGQGGGPGTIVDLSPAAAQLLGIGEGAPVRIRLVTPTPQDQMALRSGRTASTRMDAPQSLLVALRRKLPGRSAPPARTARPAPSAPGARYAPPPPTSPRPVPPRPSSPRPAPVQAAPARAGYVVQVGAFSSRDRAQAVAAQVGGRIAPAGNLFRVQIGPFADPAGAKRARDEAARRGYADARILHIE